MRRLSIGLCATLALVLSAACGDVDPAPNAAVVDTAPLELDPSDDALDDLTITVEYTDGDGDLGEGTVDVHDCRAAGLVVSAPLPPIANMDAVEDGVMIEGVLEVVVSDVGDVELDTVAPAACDELGIGAPVAGEAVFCVVLTDVAGNSGTGDCTPAVAILSAE
jgi:hypothetical protein